MNVDVCPFSFSQTTVHSAQSPKPGQKRHRVRKIGQRNVTNERIGRKEGDRIKIPDPLRGNPSKEKPSLATNRYIV